ncbi:MAG: glycosyltransferase family 39 protein, partial [Anaerolineales bacterium]|nr:glycosyltransferase family 39 protein [Anaerolineales bacterium]
TIPLIIEGTASDIHPPLYYLLLRGWRELLGETEFGLRSLSAFAGVLTVAGVMGLGELLTQRRKGAKLVVLAAGLLAAVNPALVYYSQETRMYALLALWGVLLGGLFWGWLRRTWGVGRGAWGWWVGYLVVATAGLYTHYFFPAVLLVHNVVFSCCVLRQRFTQRRKAAKNLLLCAFAPLREPMSLLSWVGLQTAVFLLYLPWLPIFLRQAGGRSAVREPFFTFLRHSLNWLAFGETYTAAGWLIGLVSLLLAWSVVTNWGNGWLLLPLAGTAVPVLFMFAVGTTQPAFFKFMGTAVPFLCLWLAFATIPSAFVRVRPRPIFFLLPLLVVVMANGRSLQALYFNPDYARVDYRGMAERIARENHPNAGIILDAPNQWEVFTYYHRDGAPVYPLPRGTVAERETLEPELAQITADHRRIYAIFWGEEQRDPERIVESWLDAHAFKATDEWVGDVRFVTYAVPSAGAGVMETAVSDVHFGDSIALLGYTIPQTTLPAGDIVEVTLFWQTAVSLDQRYKVFIHLLDSSGQLVTQRDSEPGGGLNPTDGWPVGEPIRDNYGLLLPATLPPDGYQLVVGLYEQSTAAPRLPLTAANGTNDAFPLAEILVIGNQ